MRQVVLGSSSPYRKTLLEKILNDFATCSPDIDETPLAGENPEQLVKRLALQKAQAIAPRFPDALIISSDQISLLNGVIRGKPKDFANACEQLSESSGQVVTFLTSLCLFDSKSNDYQLDIELYKVHFRTLSQPEIENYVRREQPFNCAGSFKSEGLGIALFNKLEGDDPNSLIGLPLIKLVTMFTRWSVKIL